MKLYSKSKSYIKYLFNISIGYGFEYTIINLNYSICSIKRLINLKKQCKKFQSTNYSFVECGVAKGGCLALMKNYAGENNKIFGFDSFEGMPNITYKDVQKEIKITNDFNFLNFNFTKFYIKNKQYTENPYKWVNVNLSGGIQNVFNTFDNLNLNMHNVFLIKGFFINTLKNKDNITSIGKIAILRLDSDWYESTFLCLDILYNNVVIGGVIIIDDYGCFIGAKNATDDFRIKHKISAPLIKTDNDEYYWIKTN